MDLTVGAVKATTVLKCKVSVFSVSIIMLNALTVLIDTLETLSVSISTVNAFKARLGKFGSHHADNFNFTADVTGIRNRYEEVIKK